MNPVAATFLRAAQLAAPTIHQASEDLEEKLFPFWLEAIHEALIVHQCPCTTEGQESHCLLTLSREEQERQFAGSPYAFPEFVELYRTALQSSSLLGSKPKPGEHVH